MNSKTVVQVGDATPIVLSFAKFVIRGIHGLVGLSSCTRHGPNVVRSSVGVASMTGAMVDCWKYRPGCLKRAPVISYV
jgi:hypothetical protein